LLEFNAGAAYSISENVVAFGDVSYSFDVGDSDHDSIGGQIGLKIRW
jgi:outer membrane autotransporter protein